MGDPAVRLEPLRPAEEEAGGGASTMSEAPRAGVGGKGAQFCTRLSIFRDLTFLLRNSIRLKGPKRRVFSIVTSSYFHISLIDFS